MMMRGSSPLASGRSVLLASTNTFGLWLAAIPARCWRVTSSTRRHADRVFGWPLVRALSVAVLAVCCSACAAADDASGDSPPVDVAQVQQAISGGVQDVTSKAVMAITHPAAGSLCSGSLIAKNVILTARHCVSPVQGGVELIDCDNSLFGPPDKPASFLVTSADEVTPDNYGEFSVSEVVALPEELELPGFCGNDIAILVLSENVDDSVAVPYRPRLDDAPLGAGELYSAVGYGATDGDGAGAGVRRRRDGIAVECVSDACASHTLFGEQVASSEFVGEGGVCQGDSGGPAIDADGRVIGVTSRGQPGCGVSIYAYTAAWSGWLKDTVMYASGLGVYEPPDWTEGSTVNPEHSNPIGEACQHGDECPSGKCYDDGTKRYCTRACSDEAPCPADYECIDDPKLEAVCSLVPASPRPRYQAPERGGCSVALPVHHRRRAPRYHGWRYWLLLGVLLWRRRGRA